MNKYFKFNQKEGYYVEVKPEVKQFLENQFKSDQNVLSVIPSYMRRLDGFMEQVIDGNFNETMSVKELEKVTKSYFKDWMKQVMTVKDGVKFWRFKHNYKNEGVLDKIIPIWRAKGDITDPEKGRDLIIELAKLTLNYWKEEFAKGKKEIKYIDRITPEEYPTDLEFVYNGAAIFTPSGGNFSKQGYAMPRENTPRVGVDFFIPEDMVPQGWEEIYMDLITTIRHEIEHLTQSGSNVKQGKEMTSDYKLRNLIDNNKDVVRYILLPKEVDANVQGLYLKAKKWRRPYSEVVDEYIRDFLKITNKNDVAILKGLYDKRAKELNLPSIQENDPFGIKAYARELVKLTLALSWSTMP